MRCVVQRVAYATVSVAEEVVGRIGRGLLILVAFAPTDTEAELAWTARRIVGLRLFNDAQGRMNLSLADVDGGILLVSQFTLYGDCRKGNRPSFVGAAAPPLARELYARFAALLRERWPNVAEGVFGAAMAVSLVNDGPVTVIVEREAQGSGA